jgi:hypothetical protein
MTSSPIEPPFNARPVQKVAGYVDTSRQWVDSLHDVGPVLDAAGVRAVYAAAVRVVDEWDDGDSVDPDRMDVAIAKLRDALGDG